MCEFLYNSQTFLGVLLTLNVLCIFAFKNDSESEGVNGSEINENNFILRFLHYYKEKFRAELIKLETLVKQEAISFKKSDDYIKLQSIIQNKDRYDSGIRTEAMLLEVKYSLNWTDSNSIVTDGYVELNRIEASNEQQRAPLFTLVFGLVFFFVDELVNLYQNDIYSDSIIFGWWFLFLSSIYWSVIWIFFLFRKSFVDVQGKENSFWKHFDDQIHPFWGGLIKIFICVGIFYLSIFYSFDFDEDTSFAFYVILIGLAPISIIGLWREISCGVKGRYSLTHIIGHLVSFVAYAIVITSIVTLFSNMESESTIVTTFNRVKNLNIFSNIEALRFGIIVFSLLNGLILPFVIPYIKLRVKFYFESKKIKMGLVDLMKNKKGLSTEFGNLCKSLVSSSFNTDTNKG